ncbi:Outer membrane protein,Outer membrane protein (OmpH-like) [Chlamydia serpentis]|uniref:Outer membrane protein,Outer membrane protein (OmpH-like) n=1 Tax=Chlamydia serpentis TaxID=1967782 RepID=A0A2R8FAK3_9CHLA|nr:OmpH family outer membrane protein [Chlamydia serpentis]SPN73445.1 Outer membrane protein,Outer membrane protein (OmpH-like) [Chlamydia serpentis]
MKKLLSSVVLLFLGSMTTVHADLGYVNLKRCLEESDLGKKETEELEVMKQQFLKNAEKIEEELTSIYNKLQDEDYMESLSEAASEELRKKFEDLSGEYNAYQSQYYQSINQSNVKRIQKLIQEVKIAAESVRLKEKLEAILNEEAVLAIAPDSDKTTEIIAILNESFKKQN